MANFPESLPNLTNPSPSTSTLGVHATLHGSENDEIEAIAAKVGITSSADSTSHDYKLARLYPGLSVSFAANGDVYFVAPQAMTFGSSPTEAGTGTLVYAKALAASPTSFSTQALPITLATGDILRITCSGISGYKAATIQRTA